MYSSYGTAFDGADLWSFGNDILKNVVIFGADNSSSSHSDNDKNNFLELGEGSTDDINGSVGAIEEKFTINFTKAKKSFAWVCIIMVIYSLMEKKSISLKQIINM